MTFVHKEPVNAQLLKGDHIVLVLIGTQFFQLGFQCFPGLFHLLMEKFSPAWTFSSLMAASVS